MKILEALKESEYQKLNFFFWKLWKEEFNLDRFHKMEDYENWINYYIMDWEKIISAINIFISSNWEFHIWRVWTLKEYRWQWLWTMLIKKSIETIKNKWIKELFMTAEIKNLEYCKKIWFKEIWKFERIWNTKCIKMKKNLA